MKKTLFGVFLLSIVLVSCKQGDQKAEETSTIEQKELAVENSSFATTASSIDVERVTQTSTSTEAQMSESKETKIPNTKTSTQSNDNDLEEKYFNLIKEARQRQIDYINSIEDPNIKQSVQSSHSAAVFESSSLAMDYPEDQEIIMKALQRVLKENQD